MAGDHEDRSARQDRRRRRQGDRPRPGDRRGGDPDLLAARPRPGGARTTRPEEVEAYKQRSAETGIGPALHPRPLPGEPGDGTTRTSSRSPSTRSSHEMNVCLAASARRGVIFHLGSHKGAGYEACLRAGRSSTAGRILDGDAGGRLADPGEQRRHGRRHRLEVRGAGPHHPRGGQPAREGLPGHAARLRRRLRPEDEGRPRRRRWRSSRSEIGLDRLVAVHANDSKCPLAGGLDRHENIGEGHIGRDGFVNILAAPGVRGCPVPAGGPRLRQRRAGPPQRGYPEVGPGPGRSVLAPAQRRRSMFHGFFTPPPRHGGRAAVY